MAKAMYAIGNIPNYWVILNEVSPNLLTSHFVGMGYVRSFIEVLLRTRIRASASYAVSLAETAYTTANTPTGYTSYPNDLTDYFNFVDFNLKDDSFH